MKQVLMLCVLLLAMAGSAYLGARWQVDDIYLTCRENDFYLVRQADEYQKGRVIMCDGMTGDELAEALQEEQAANEDVVDPRSITAPDDDAARDPI